MTGPEREMPCGLERHEQGIETTHEKHLLREPEYSTGVSKKATFQPENRQVTDARVLQSRSGSVYYVRVAAKSAPRFSDRQRQRRTSAHNEDAGAFFVPAHLSYGGGAWETFGSAGSFVPGSLTRVSAAPHCLATVTAVPKSDKGTDIMNNPLATLHQSRANAQRAMALAALRSNSSLSVRRDRYNQHMNKARAAEARAQKYAVTNATRKTTPQTRTTSLSLKPNTQEARHA